MCHDILPVPSLAGADFVNANARIILSVPLPSAIALPGPVLPDKDLLASILVGHSCLDRDPSDERLADFDVVAFCQKKYLLHIELFTDFIGKLLYTEAVALFGAVLPAATFNDCVHTCLQKGTGFVATRLPVLFKVLVVIG